MSATGRLWLNFTEMTGPAPPMIERGEGCHVFDIAGRRYLDFLAGLFTVQIGYSFGAELGAAAAAQAGCLPYFPTWRYAHPVAVALAERLRELAPVPGAYCFFVSGGSEGVETAIKLAREYHNAAGDTGRHLVISRQLAYHGTTFGALAVSGIDEIRTPFEPVPAFGRRVSCTSPSLCRHCAGRSGCTLACADEIESVIVEEGADRVSLVLAEPLQNSGGMIPPPAGYHERVSAICAKYGVLYGADEVITAFGRLGAWFGASRYGYQPDLIVCAKGLTSGHQPMGAVLFSDRIAERFHATRHVVRHGFTFSGHPVAAAVALANLDVLEREGLLDNVRRNEPHFRAALHALRDRHRIVAGVQGDGYAWALRLVRDREAGEPFPPAEHEALLEDGIAGAARASGLLIGIDAAGGEPTIHLAPPLIATSGDIDRAVEILDGVLAGIPARWA